MDSVKLYAGYGGMIDLENDKLVHDRGKFVRSSDYQALRARLGEVETANARLQVEIGAACHSGDEALKALARCRAERRKLEEKLTFARQELAAVLEGQEILKRQTVRIREALGAEPGEDTEEAARRVRQELAELQRLYGKLCGSGAQEIMNMAYEKAAQVCEDAKVGFTASHGYALNHAATAIRALKLTKETAG